MLLSTTREENLYSSRKSLVTRHFNSGVPEPDVCFNVQIVNNGSSCMSLRISDQSYAIHSELLHTDNNWNNWTAWKLLSISFLIRSNVTSQHEWQDERLIGQFPISVDVVCWPADISSPECVLPFEGRKWMYAVSHWRRLNDNFDVQVA